MTGNPSSLLLPSAHHMRFAAPPSLRHKMMSAATLRLRAALFSFTFGIAALIACGGGTEPGGGDGPDPSAATSTVTISSAAIASGSSATITLTAKDASGALIASGGASVVFSLGAGGTSAGTISAAVDNGNGTYSATLTGTTSGTARSIAAVLEGAAVTTAMPTFTVTPGQPSPVQSTVSVGAGTVAVGGTTTVTATLKDAAGNSIITGGATVAFTLGSGTSTGTFGGVTDNGNGTYTSTFTATVAGSARAIGATVNGSAIASTLPTITVTASAGPISPATSVVSVSSSSVASGNTVTLTLQGKDAAGTNVAAGGATIVFSTTGSGTSAGTIGATTDNANGTYTASFTGTTTGTPKSIQATINGAVVSTALPTVTVTPGAFSASQSQVSVSSAAVVTGHTTTVTATLRDAAGNQLASGGSTVAFTLGAGSSGGTFGAVTDNANGTYSAVFTAGAAGTARTVGATVGGTAISSTLPTITVTATAAGPISAATSTVTVGSATVISGATTTITLQAKDAAGVSLGSGGATVVISLEANAAGKSDGTVGSVTDNANGTYSATFTATTAGTARAVQATINGAAVTTAMPTLTVTPGAISPAQSTVSVGSATVVSGSATTVTLQAKDAAGNTITSGGATVAFALGATGTSTGNFSAVSDNGNGTYTASFTGMLAGTARSIAATIGGSSVTTAQPAIAVTVGPISPLTSLVSISTANVASNATATVTLQGKDAAGNTLTTGAGNPTVAFNLSGAGTSNGSFGSVTNNNNGTWTATFTPNAAGSTRTVTATIDAATVQTTAPSFIVFDPGMTLSSNALVMNVTQGTVGATEIVGVFANGGLSVGGLSASVNYGTVPAGCNATWVGTPTFDFTTANPVALVSINPSAAGLQIQTCTATLTISSTTPGVTSKTVALSIAVARGPVALTAVNLVAMGNNNGNPAPQTISPDARVLITNGGKGVITGLHASVSNSKNQIIGGSEVAWLTNSDLSWEPVVGDTNARTAPATLVVRAVAAPTNATADITVTGNGMTPLVIPIQVFFNINPALVTNPRGLMFTAFAGSSTPMTATVVGFNQNRTVDDSLMDYAIDNLVARPSWITNATVTPLNNASGRDTAATYAITVNPSGMAADSIASANVGLKAQVCGTGVGTCSDAGFGSTFSLPVKLVIERGLVLPVSDVTIFVPVGTTPVTKDIPITNGGSTTISGLSAAITGTATPALTPSILGTTTAPSTLRLSVNPTGKLRGATENTVVTVAASSPSGVPSKIVTVTIRYY
jgi:adhesin/invasin